MMPQRRSIRLRDYDYSQPGAYFVTICTAERVCLFGAIADDAMHPNAWGDIAAEERLRSGEIRREIGLDAFVVMPNHVHDIVFINETVGAIPAVEATGPMRQRVAPLRRIGGRIDRRRIVAVMGPACWVFRDVAANTIQCRLVMNDVIIITALPNRCARRTSHPIDANRDRRFVSGDERPQRPRRRAW